ncbi:phosphotransferase [Nocardioides limicola]|uniref:phosphotransferase n=1 Tax=Nocardioides limicola TaxID=2803368 RepID=UPI00193B640E|nr:phosphotransferase [Nocardioides sp. DJM-14]
MWQPEPGWVSLPGGLSASTLGVWRASIEGRAVVVKRLIAPSEADPPEYSDPEHFAYWRRSADVVSYDAVTDTPGLRGPTSEVSEDADGITIVADWVEDAANPGLFAARSMGAFAGAEIGHLRWLARRQLRDRLARVAQRGGWPTLAQTSAARVTATLWDRRDEFLDLIDQLPQVPQHGDPIPANLPGRDGDTLVAVDWGSLGLGPVGGDLGYHMLMAREEFEPLLDAYLLGLPDGLASPDQVGLGARVTGVYTVLTRVEWALARAAEGEGELALKFRHPSVAPHLRSLQRQAAHVEALLGW